VSRSNLKGKTTMSNIEENILHIADNMNEFLDQADE